jgi:SSS family solute:Na+ symporter
MLHPFIKSPINAGAIAMLAGLVIVPLVSLLGPRPNKKRMEQIFGCYEDKVLVPKRTALSGNGE